MGKVPAGLIEEYLGRLARFGWHLGLDRIEALLAGLGHPERAFPAVQVAGTNGKGSTAAMLASILAAAGCRTGLYTSPHLESYRERLAILEERSSKRAGRPARICRRLVAGRRLASVLGRVMAVADEVARGPAGAPTEFEVLTATAAQWFAEEQVDVAVLEVGLGGRLDATTAVPALLAVLTHIDLDHTDRLGSTLAAIAAEKAAIIRPGRPVVVAPQAGEAWAVIARQAAGQGSPVFAVSEGREGAEPRSEGAAAASVAVARYAVEGVTWRHTTFTYFPAAGPPLEGLRTALLGRHQATNAAVALAAALALRREGFATTEEAIRRGLASARWPGRLEVLRRRPLVVVDGAHNPDGMRRLVEAWKELSPGRRPLVVCGFLRDRPVAEMVAALAGLAGEVIVTRPASDRAAEPVEVAGLFASHGVDATVEGDPTAAACLALARPSVKAGAPVLGCGTLYLVGALRRAWRPKARASTGEGSDTP
ncbi:MAG: Mur ligase family protein [Bacillota bacterium]|nr:Mur ligase family protein [Bacillota bacterium]